MEDLSTFVGVFGALILIMVYFNLRRRPPEDRPKVKPGGADMALSAGRDAGNKTNMAQEVHVPMEPEEEPAMRAFYLDLIGMDEMRAPTWPKEQDGFWAILGTRRTYFGLSPSFTVKAGILPTFAIRDLDAMADRLTTAGHEIAWDNRFDYARRLATLDPAGNGIVFVRG
ncbi:hypothetical protein [Yoonia sp. 2307UL14-13]|uniref:hypothetical protein n=1 Tax=Yoonia sp. 2307UL14-13 TaxID=3126506 RepID=UPI0030AA9C98